MKFEIVTRYLARLYIREQRTAPTLMRLAADLAEKAELNGWEPTQVNDFDIGTAQVSQGYLLRSPDQSWSVKVTDESFDVQVAQGYNLQTRAHLAVPTFTEYLKRVRGLFEVGMKLVTTKPHRIAVVQGGILAPPQGNAPSLDSVRDRLINLPAKQGAPFEWNWRTASKVDRTFGACAETTNTIMLVRLSSVSHVERLGDRLLVDLDINTDPANATPRFSAEDVMEFVSSSGTWHADLEQTLFEHAGIGS